MLYYYLPDHIVFAIRFICLICTVVTSVSVNKFSLTFFCLTLGSLYILRKNSKKTLHITSLGNLEKKNPFISKQKAGLSQLSLIEIQKAKDNLFDYFFDDFSYSPNLQAFETIKNNSECVFAKRSNLWSTPNKWNKSLTIRENVYLSIIPSFIIFSNFLTSLKLDGFLVQLPGQLFGKDLKTFGAAFKEILTCLAESDPSGNNCMKTEIERRGWVFEFNKITFFITTFSPNYPETSSRYTFGVDECFILFQPEISFAFHNLPEDTHETNWDEPRTVRDKIRLNFRRNNREYLIRETISYPMCLDMIKPCNKNDEIIKWWI